MPRILLSLLLYLVAQACAFAQESCGNERYREHLELYPGLLSHYDAMLRQVNEGSQALGESSGEVLVIPIVVHVFHLGEPVGTGTNISDQQILDAVRGANERWRNLAGEGVDMEIEFCLAQFDPQGNPSSGIVRVDASHIPNYAEHGISYLGGTGANELQLKGTSNWPHNYVYNIWVVNKISGGWAGFAMFPLSFNYLADGTVMDYRYMTYQSATLAHEFGHGFWLFHTFEGEPANGCPPNLNCNTQGDWVCDTPPHRRADCSSTACNTGGLDLNNSFRNIMSYCGAQRVLFTEGQKARAHSAVRNTARRALLNSTACGYRCPVIEVTVEATTCDMEEAGTAIETFSTAEGCDSTVTTVTTLIPPPVAEFSYNIGEGGQVSFQNLSENSNGYTWDFGDGQGSSDSDPVHTYTAAGTFTVTLTATNDCDDDVVEESITLSPSRLNDRYTAADIRLYPNPGDGRFRVELPAPHHGSLNLRITDLLGRVVWREEYPGFHGNSLSLDTRLPAGIYWLQVSGEEQMYRAVPVVVEGK